MKTAFALPAATLLAFAASAPAAPTLLAQDAPEAVVVRLTGDVRVEPATGDAMPATVGRTLAVGDRLVPSTDARAVIVHRSGVKEEIAAPTTVQAAGAGADAGGDMMTRTVRVLARAATANARSQPNRQGMIRPIPGEPVPLAPRNGIAVRTGHPTFRWTPVEGAEGYTLQIRTPGEPPVRHRVEEGTTWTLPDDAAALAAGREYWWTVAPGGGRARAAREQRFTVLAADRAEEVGWNLDAIRALGLDPWGDGALLTVTVFADFGLYYEAAAALEALEAGGSMSAELYLLKGEVLDALGDLDGARTAFDRADRMTG